jgi:hypothetical protein
MKESIAELEYTLKNGDGIPLKRRILLFATLEKMKVAAKIVSNIPCSGPLMSFDLAYVAGRKSAARTATRKKR